MKEKKQFKFLLLASLVLLYFLHERLFVGFPYLNLFPDQINTILYISVIIVAYSINRPLKNLIRFYLLLSCFFTFIYSKLFFSQNLFLLLVLAPRIDPSEIKNLFFSVTELVTKIVKRFPWQSLMFFNFIGATWFYSSSFSAYFQGDEWVFFRYYLPLVQSKWWLINGFIQSFLGVEDLTFHISPVTNWLSVISTKLFRLNYQAYFSLSLFVFVLTSTIVGRWAYELSRSKQVGFLTSLFFLFSSTHSQAVTWISASLNTQLSVFFGLLGLILLWQSKQTTQKVLASGLCMILAFFSKETALIFLLLALVVFFLNKNRLIKPFLLVYCSISTILLLTNYSHFEQFFSQKNNDIVFSEPWSFRAIHTFENLKLYEVTFNYVTFTLKGLAQSFIPIGYISKLGVSLTDSQFPFFNQEKSVGGTTYLSFTQGPMVELVSYIFGLIILFIIGKIVIKQPRRVRLFSIVYLFVMTLPVMAIIYQFPWWRYSSVLDSRHLFHYTPLLFFLFSYGLFIVTKRFEQEQRRYVVYLLVLVVYISFQSYWQEVLIKNLKKDAHFDDRRQIVSALQKSIDPLPSKVIIYTTSNKSFYGFGELMLPFQTPFAHALPVIFSKPMNRHGLVYPKSFYDKNYLKNEKGGLVVQGYHEENGFGLGYFLEMTPLIKKLEEMHLQPETVYAFDYNGDKDSFEDITPKVRNQITQMLEDRKELYSWGRYGGEEDKFSFQVPAHLVVHEDNTVYTILDKRKSIVMRITVFQNPERELFSVFATDQLGITGQENSYRTVNLEVDLDKIRPTIVPNTDLNVFFTYAGTNDAFYKIEQYDLDLSSKILQTFEFIDYIGDEISLP